MGYAFILIMIIPKIIGSLTNKGKGFSASVQTAVPNPAYRSANISGTKYYLCNRILNLFVLGILNVLDELDVVSPVSHG